MRESTVISITNSKGGVGKTTTALNLGAALAAAKKRVLLIDNDPQGNLTAALGYTPGEQKNTLAKLVLVQIDSPEDLDLHLPRTVIHTETGIDLIPANKRLADAAARLQVMQLSQYNAAGFSDALCEKIMDKLLTSLREQYDYIIIDCGLKHELLTINALAAADYCIIPVQAHFLASEGIPDVLEMVKNVQNRFNPDLKIAGILLTMYQSRPQLCQSVRNTTSYNYNDVPICALFNDEDLTKVFHASVAAENDTQVFPHVSYSYTFNEIDETSAEVRFTFSVFSGSQEFPASAFGVIKGTRLPDGDILWEGPLDGTMEIEGDSFDIIVGFAKLNSKNEIQAMQTSLRYVSFCYNLNNKTINYVYTDTNDIDTAFSATLS